jgi:hypothetical protein
MRLTIHSVLGVVREINDMRCALGVVREVHDKQCSGDCA